MVRGPFSRACRRFGVPIGAQRSGSDGERRSVPDFECRSKRYRLMKELTQEQFAVQVGVRRETIMRLEKAQYDPSLKLAVDISRAVEAPIEDISIFP